MSYAIFVFGHAGVGKSTFCRNLREHGKCVGRNYEIINLDPAQASTEDEYAVDLRDFITVDEVMEHYDYGPNGGLIAALETLYKNIDELQLEEMEGSFLVFDCPGQVELFIHSEVMSGIVEYVGKYFRCGIIYMIESQYLTDINKYISACFCALISMARFSVPCINVISKIDLVRDENLEMFYIPTEELAPLVDTGRYSKLNLRILDFVVESSMLKFHPLDWNEEHYLEEIVYYIDNALQYYDDAEPRTRDQD